MPASTLNSFQILAIPKPFIITSLIIVKNHLVGTIFESNCIGLGIFSMGNIKPLSINVGNISPIMEINIAVCWELVRFEIIKPSEIAVVINKKQTPNNKKISPFIGRSSKVTLKIKMVQTLISEIKI